MPNILTFRSPHDTISRTPASPASQPTLEAELAEGLSEINLRLLDAAFHNAGLIASEDPSPPAPEEQDEIAALNRFVDAIMSRP